ncbi:hypothetical protein BJ741DRAFT_586526 [Chytriomyces cf. hyalinus JEL632]|nr:hypothetical protein BJ741DRAFT_586526 [Chytriomyces cf. hyalinus JEL632]
MATSPNCDITFWIEGEDYVKDTQSPLHNPPQTDAWENLSIIDPEESPLLNVMNQDEELSATLPGISDEEAVSLNLMDQEDEVATTEDLDGEEDMDGEESIDGEEDMDKEPVTMERLQQVHAWFVENKEILQFVEDNKDGVVWCVENMHQADKWQGRIARERRRAEKMRLEAQNASLLAHAKEWEESSKKWEESSKKWKKTCGERNAKVVAMKREIEEKETKLAEKDTAWELRLGAVQDACDHQVAIIIQRSKASVEKLQNLSMEFLEKETLAKSKLERVQAKYKVLLRQNNELKEQLAKQ